MTNTHINVGGHKVSAGKVYSTSEVKTGDVWIDGKPIYRRVITDTTPTLTANLVSDFPIADMGNADIYLIRAYGTLKSIAGYEITIPLIYPTNAGVVTQAGYVYVGSTKTNLMLFTTQSTTAADYSNAPFTIVLEYTKTSD